MRIGYFSPLPPEATGVADYSASLLSHLRNLAEVTLFTNEPLETVSRFPCCFSVRPIDSFAGPLHEAFDMCLYQMGNNVRFHTEIYATLVRYPGVTTLHDLNLHSFYSELLLKRGRKSSYTRELAYAGGAAGTHHARRAQRGLTNHKVQEYPLIERVGDVSLGIVVHSCYAKQVVLERCPDVLVTHINQPVSVAVDSVSPRAAKVRLGFEPDDLLLASFGYISPNKRVDVALKALARIRGLFPNLRYVLVGKAVEGVDLRALVTELGLNDIVRIAGYVDRDTFRTYLAAADVGINLRHPTLGETSATMLELMAVGKPTLISKVDAFVEVPDSICVKIDPGSREQAEIEGALRYLLENRDVRRRVGRKAVEYIRRECRPETVATKYVAFIRRILGEGEIDVL